MPIQTKRSGAWVPVKSLFFKQNNAWVPVQRAYTKRNGTWVEIFSAAVTATISATTTNVNLSSLFSVADWQSTKKKVVVVPAGVTVGSNNPAIAAIATGTGMGGLIDLIISGQVQGAGGLANGGTGGDAINNQLNAGQLSITVNSGALVRSGGGGGGRGGPGTATTYINRDPPTGQYYTVDFGGGPSTYWINYPDPPDENRSIFWKSSTAPVAKNIPLNSTVWDVGGYRYYRGTNPDGLEWYGVARAQISTGSTTGGEGGRGQGHDTPQVAGSLGGTNAGVGGGGGTWGAAGANGNAGNAGAGSAGGAPGRAITGAARTLVNNGTIVGAT